MKPITQCIRRKIKVISLLAILAAVLMTGVPARADRVPQEIRVGTHLPLSGILASIGVENRWAYETAVDDINKAGGIYLAAYDRKLPVRLVVLDDESSPSKTVAAVYQLINQENVDFILSGHSAAYGVIPGCIAAERNKVYYHATASFAQPWLAHHFQWSTLLFVDMAALASVPFKLWDTLPLDQRPKRAALIMADTFDGLALGGMFQKKASEYGYRFIMDASLPSDSKDYSTLISKAKKLDVDAILIFASSAECISFIRQMKKNNLNVKYLHGFQGTWPVEFGQVLGRDAQYVVTDGHWSERYKAPGAKELGQRYYRKFHKHSVSIGAFYALAQILWQAIEKAGYLDPALVRQAVLEGEFKTTLGNIDYNSKGVGFYPSPAFQWIDGQQVLIYPFNLADQKLQMAPPWDQR